MNRTMSADLAGAHLAVVRRYGDRRPEFPACVIDWGRSDTATRQVQDAVRRSGGKPARTMRADAPIRRPPPVAAVLAAVGPGEGQEGRAA